MRKFFTLAATAAVLSVAALTAAPSQAMTFGAPAGVRGAADGLNLVDKAACWRYGWHGWGWYPCYGYVRPYRYGYGYGYGWHHRHWRRW
jgi:hypothetical protein